jgi:hypothetical protein
VPLLGRVFAVRWNYNVHLTRYSAIAVPTLLLIGGASPTRQ